jgi:hypothetical protein
MSDTLQLPASRRLLAWAMSITALLTLPLIAMQFTSEVSWGVGDFLAAALLLGGAALALELALRRVRDIRARVIIGLAIGLCLVMIWAQLAVGLI